MLFVKQNQMIKDQKRISQNESLSKKKKVVLKNGFVFSILLSS